MAKITFNVPAQASRARSKPVVMQKEGTVAYFPIGATQVKFVLQHGPSGKPVALTHYASGQIFGYLNGPKVEHMCARGHHARLSDRAAAKCLIERTVARIGADETLAKLAAVPVLNP